MKSFFKKVIPSIPFSVVLGLFLTFICIVVIIVSILINLYYTNKAVDIYIENRLKTSSFLVLESIRRDYSAKLTDKEISQNAERIAYLNGLYICLKNSKQQVLVDTINPGEKESSKVKHYSTPVFLDNRFYGTLIVASENNFGLMHRSGRIFYETINKSAYLTFFIGIIISLVFIIILTSVLSTPLKKITRKTRSIKYLKTNQIDITTKIYEIQSLIDSLNFMIMLYHEEEKWRQSLLDDLGHELRTPLTIISTQIEAICDGIIEYSPERAQNIFEEVNRLTKLIEDIQTLSIAEGAKFELDYKKHDACSVVKHVINSFKPVCKKRNIKLEYIPPYKPCPVICDRDRIIQAVYNLVSNAVKYSKDNTRINVKVFTENGYIHIAVKDRGIGIPEDCLGKIFKRFYRVDRSRSVEIQGSGLGLCIAKSLVECHKGEITVKSMYGYGSTFTIVLPQDI